MTFSVVIPTFNGAAQLGATLASLSEQDTSSQWEVVVVVNNATDDTPDVLTAAARRLDGRLRVIAESEQGHCAALNAGIAAAHGDTVLITNQDVIIPPDWIEQAGRALTLFGCDYVGGRALPIWGAPRPAWLPDRPGPHQAVLALLDYGPEPLAFGERVPLGCNMAFRRQAFAAAGLWDNRLGRKPGTLIGQDVREWGIRARAAGLRGMYAPDMVIHHEVSSNRMTKAYFRRWMYWHGVSRAIMYRIWRVDMERPEQQTHDFSAVPHIGGVPRYLYRSKLLTSLRGFARASLVRDAVTAFEHEMQLCFFAGIVRQRWKDRQAVAPHPTPSAGDDRTGDQRVPASGL